MQVLPRFRRSELLKTCDLLIGALFCALLAVLVCLVVPLDAQRAVVPSVFIVVVIAMAMRFGAGAGVLGCILSAVIFAFFLFRPLGSIAIANSAAKSNLVWMILLGVPGSYLFAPTDDEPAKRK
jgi:K+-sensing histidine kinase KdpD